MALVTNYHKPSGLNNMNLFSYGSVGQNTDTTMLQICPSEERQDFLNISYLITAQWVTVMAAFSNDFSDKINILKG